jgi:hypothetical protein
VLIPGFGVLIAIVILAFVPWPTHRGGFGGLAAGDG